MLAIDLAESVADFHHGLLEGLDYPTGTLNTEELSFIDNLIAHNFLIVNAEIIPASEVGRRGALRLTLPNSFDLRGSQAALSTLPCWPPPDQPALSNPPAGALERARQNAERRSRMTSCCRTHALSNRKRRTEIGDDE